MILIFKLIALTSIWVLGIKIATADEMVLEKLGKWGKKKVEQGHKIFEALIVCQWCMPSIHSTIGYAIAYGLGIIQLRGMLHVERLLIMYPIVVMGSSIVCGMIWLIYETLNRIHDRNEVQGRYYNHVERMAFWDCEERKKQHSRNKKN